MSLKHIAAGLMMTVSLSACSGAVSGKAPYESVPQELGFAAQVAQPTAPSAEVQRAAMSLSSAPQAEGELPSAVFNPYNLVSYEILIPQELTVSEANLYYPVADIVWRGDAHGNRKQQIAAIFQNSLSKARGGATGGTDVKAIVTLEKFHSLTEKTRYTIGGWHEIRFNISLVDATTGEVLVANRVVRADLNGLGGRRAIEAERQGLTQKVRIQAHLDRVIRAELAEPGGWTRRDIALSRSIDQI
ncbi:DUF6778 family protein [Sagittula sp. SSi028]|uniref:DUF6778 family protein n=1 Tax=Sagittula sp. SSi028 TaxID=3400636 RepID=UPI003AF4AA13